MIVGALRIKNEQRWISRVLRSMLPVCERIFILDDHSTDQTREICLSFREVALFESPFEGVQETRDKNALLDTIEARTTNGDVCVFLDGDEELAPGSAAIIQALAEQSPADAYSFQVLYLWNDERTVRTDGIYGRFYRPSMFRLHKGDRFTSSCGGGFHCGNVPGSKNEKRCDVRLLHYGYMHREDRIRKWHFYNAHDPMNFREG